MLIFVPGAVFADNGVTTAIPNEGAVARTVQEKQKVLRILVRFAMAFQMILPQFRLEF